MVLGGTSIFGGRGSVGGTLLGLTAIALLRNGLRLADLPAELAEIATGVLLLAAIGLDRRAARPRSPAPTTPNPEGFAVKNAQVALLCASIVGAGLIVAATNAVLVVWLAAARSVVRRPIARPGRPALSDLGGRRPDHGGDDAQEQGQRLLQGLPDRGRGGSPDLERPPDLGRPDRPRPGQAERDRRHLDHPGRRRDRRRRREPRGDLLGPPESAGRGIKVITWDADAEPDARSFFVNQATPEGVADVLMAEAASVLGESGQVRHHHRVAHRRATWSPGRRRSRSSGRANTPTCRWPRSGRATTSRKRRSTRRPP